MLKSGAESAQGGTNGARIALMLSGVLLDGDAVGVADFKQFAVFAADLAEAEIQGGEFAFDDRFVFVWRLLGEHGDEFLAEDESAGVGDQFPPGVHDVIACGAECPGFEVAAGLVFVPFFPERHIHLLEDVHVVGVRW